ncbi:MAG: dienelactone hydrolase family protein [Lactobacillus porci]|nr:dienelactone hydrolase family protein [Lactobacillus porci]
MQQEMTIKHDNLEVQGIWGQATNPIDGAAPLVIFAGVKGEDANDAAEAQYLNDAGIQTFAFEADSFEAAKKDLPAVFEELRQKDQVASEYIVLVGFGQGGRAAALAASRLGKSVSGIFLMAPVFMPSDLLELKKYQGVAYVLAGSLDGEAPMSNLSLAAKTLPRGELLEIRDAKHAYRLQDVERAAMLLRTLVMTALN